MADMFEVGCLGVEPAGRDLLSVRLEYGPWSTSHERPGQYILWQPPGAEKPSPMALANAPAEEPALLVRAQGEKYENLTKLAGTFVKCSAPAGPGFPVGDAAGKPLLVVAVGTAMAPIRAAVTSALAGPSSPSRLCAVFGVRSEEDLPFGADIDLWGRQGAEVHLTYSQPTLSESPKGRVQTLLGEGASVWADGLADDGLCFVCGHPEMMDAVTALCQAQGLAKDRVFRNF